MLLWIFTIAYKLFVKMRSWVLISFLSIAMFVVDLLLMSYLNYLVLVLNNLMVVTDGSILLPIYLFVLKLWNGNSKSFVEFCEEVFNLWAHWPYYF